MTMSERTPEEQKILAAMQRNWNQDDTAAASIANYEDKAVRKLLTILGKPQVIQDVSREAQRRVETNQLNFALFQEMYNFPIRCGVGKFRAIYKISLPDLFNRFISLAMVEGLIELANEYNPKDGPIALIFRWGVQGATSSGKSQGIKGGTHMAIHTIERDPEHIPGKIQVQVTSTIKIRKKKYRVTLEPMEAMLGPYLDWDPEC